MNARSWLCAGACALAAAGSASAHEFQCAETVNGVTVYTVSHYPDTLHFVFRITNAMPVPSTALKVEDDFFAALGLWQPVPQFTLPPGGSVQRTIDVTVRDAFECQAFAGDPLTCTGIGSEYLRIVTETSETHCSARVVCAPGYPPDGGVPDGGVTDGGTPDGGIPDGGQPDGGEIDGGVPDGGVPDGGTDGGTPGCEPGAGVKHGLGWWKVHEQPLGQCLAAGPISLGALGTISDVPHALGILWADPGTFSDGTKRGKLDQQRFILGRELLVATCDVRVLGAVFVGNEVADALALLNGTDCVALQAFHLKLDKDRDCDPNVAVDPGPATPQHAQAIALDPSGPSGQSCSKGGTP